MLIVWCTTYQKLMHRIFCSELWCLFDFFMRVMLNQAAHKERPFSRNLAFNLIRCLQPEFVAYTTYERLSPLHILVFHVAMVTLFTYLVQENCTKKSFKNNADAWVALRVFHIVSYGIGKLDALTRVDEHFHSNITRTMYLFVTDSTTYFVGDLAEDFLFNDIGTWGGIWHNWGYFVIPSTVFVSAYFLNHCWIKWSHPRGAYRHDSGVAFSIAHYQMPLVWPHTHFNNTPAEDDRWCIVFMSNAVYAYITLWYSIQWKLSLKKGKPKKVSPELLKQATYQPELSK